MATEFTCKQMHNCTCPACPCPREEIRPEKFDLELVAIQQYVAGTDKQDPDVVEVEFNDQSADRKLKKSGKKLSTEALAKLNEKPWQDFKELSAKNSDRFYKFLKLSRPSVKSGEVVIHFAYLNAGGFSGTDTTGGYCRIDWDDVEAIKINSWDEYFEAQLDTSKFYKL